MTEQQPCERCGRPAEATEIQVEIRMTADPATIGREVVRTLRELSRRQGPGRR